MMETFNYCPSFGTSKTVQPRTRIATFGDGYEQRTADGIHTQLKEWSLMFNGRSSAEANSIEAFLSARNGVEAFEWTDPDGHLSAWVCDGWSKSDVQSPSSNRYANISATFREVVA